MAQRGFSGLLVDTKCCPNISPNISEVPPPPPPPTRTRTGHSPVSAVLEELQVVRESERTPAGQAEAAGLSVWAGQEGGDTATTQHSPQHTTV